MAIKEVDKAFGHLVEAKKHLIDIYGSNANAWRTEVLTSNQYYGNLENAAQKSKEAIKKNMWSYIVEKTQIRHLLSEKKKQELDRMMENETLPEVEADTVQAFITNLAGNLPNLFKEACCEVFDMLRPPRSEYKTNTEFEIGEKVIMNYMVDCSWGGCSLEYSREQSLINLDNVFHLLDGKGGTKYPYDLVTTIKTAIRDKLWTAETEYFLCKWYKKQSMHITFKRMDLVQQLNSIAGGNRIKS
jgi:hypothetical protein